MNYPGVGIKEESSFTPGVKVNAFTKQFANAPLLKNSDNVYVKEQAATCLPAYILY
jgi:hypothetical protein